MAAESVRLEGLQGVLDVFERFPIEMGKAGGPVKLGLKKGADRLRDAAIRNVVNIVLEPNLDGSPSKSTLLLAKSIQSKRSRVSAGLKGEAFVVAVRRNQKYAANRQNKAGNLTAVQVGRLLETGTEKRRAHPWLRPAFESDGMGAMRDAVDEMERRAQALAARLDREASKK